MTPIAVPDDTIPPPRRLELARDDLAEWHAVRDKLRLAHADLDRGQAHRRELRDRLTQAEIDVEQGGRMTPSRLWSALRGSRRRDLKRGKAAITETTAALERTGAALGPLRTDVEALARRAAQLDRADQEYEAALEALASAGLPANDQRAADAVRELSRRRESRDVERARLAAVSALQLLLAGHATLSNAASWSTWDALGAGGRMSSDMKYERLDEARQQLTEAGRGLARLSRVFDGLSVPALAIPEFGDLVRELDRHWDFSIADWLVHTEILASRGQLDEAIHTVRQVLESLERRSVELSTDLTIG